MHIASTFEEAASDAPMVCTIGMFDGVHLGHRALIGAAVADAKARGMRSAVITFFPHPREVLSGVKVMSITSPLERADLIGALGVDTLLMLRFTRELADMSAEAFVIELVRYLKMRALWVGQDFALGRNRTGTPAHLADLGAQLGFDVRTLGPVEALGGAVSSTRVREAIQQGDWEAVRQMLGHNGALEL